MKLFISTILLSIIFVSCNEATLQGSNNTKLNIEAKKTVVQKSSLWENGSTINILLLNGTQEQKSKISKYASQWTRYANLNFSFYNLGEISQENADVRILLGKKCDSNYSQVGTYSRIKSESPSMCFTSIYKKNVLHEFGHMLGLLHEHNHPDFKAQLSDNIIEKCMRIYGWSKEDCTSNFSLRNKNVEVKEYDKNSIMHYLFHDSFYKDKDSSDSFGSLGILSLNDRLQIAKIYPGRSSEDEIIDDYYSEFQLSLENDNCKVKKLSREVLSRTNCTNNRTFIIQTKMSYTSDEGIKRSFWRRLNSSCYIDKENALRDMYYVQSCNL